MPKVLLVDWQEVKTLALATSCRDAAQQFNLNVNTVMQRSAREGWFAERHKAKEELAKLPDVRAELIAKAAGYDVSEVSRTPSAAELLAQSSANNRALASRLAGRALARLDRSDDDELILPEIADVATKWTGTAAKAGGWRDAEGAAQVGVVNVNLLCVQPAQVVDCQPVTMDVDASVQSQ